MKKKKKIFVSVLVIFIICVMFRCSIYYDGWECKKFLLRMKLEGPDCLKIHSVGLSHKSREFFLWYDVSGGVENHIEEILSVKTLAEKLLTETGEIPEEYRIWIQFRTLGDVITFCNTADDYMAEETGGPIFGGYHLFEAGIFVDCNLSELSALENAKYLSLEYGMTMDDVSGLQNMEELIYILRFGATHIRLLRTRPLQRKRYKRYRRCIQAVMSVVIR